MIANEPCVAYFRIQEHVHKTVPQLVDTKVLHLVIAQPHVSHISITCLGLDLTF